MDDSRFDELTKILGAPTRRGLAGAGGFAVLATLFGREAADKALAKKRGKKKQKRKKKRKPPEPCGGETVCIGGRFCCDDEREICCNPGDSCCNVGPGTGSCCSPPNRCARPVGSDGVPFECCPPERQSFAFGVVRCCPVGERSLGTEISSDDGPCCPEEKYCSEEATGGKCCPDDAPVCLDRATGTCCNEEATCGDTCCSPPNPFCVDPDAGLCCEEERACGDTCCSPLTPFCVDPAAGKCCEEERACGSVCCQADSGFGLEDGEICTREGCCLEIKSGNNCRADHPTGTPCTEKICCDHVWTEEGRGLFCPPGAGVPPETRGYCCGPGKSCCFTGCCPDGSSCCGGGMNCCPDGAACGSEACFDPVPDHV